MRSAAPIIALFLLGIVVIMPFACTIASCDATNGDTPIMVESSTPQSDDRFDWDGTTLTLKDGKSCEHVRVKSTSDVVIVIEGSFTINDDTPDFDGLEVYNPGNLMIAGGELTINITVDPDACGIYYSVPFDCNKDSGMATIMGSRINVNTLNEEGWWSTFINGTKDLAIIDSTLCGRYLNHGIDLDGASVTIRRSHLDFESPYPMNAIDTNGASVFSDAEPTGEGIRCLDAERNERTWASDGGVSSILCDGSFKMDFVPVPATDCTAIIASVSVAAMAFIAAIAYLVIRQRP